MNDGGGVRRIEITEREAPVFDGAEFGAVGRDVQNDRHRDREAPGKRRQDRAERHVHDFDIELLGVEGDPIKSIKKWIELGLKFVGAGKDLDIDEVAW